MEDGMQVEDRGGARFVTLARPPLNVLDLATIHALHDALAPLPGRRDLKALVLRSAVDGAFSAGVDMAAHEPARAPEMLRAFHAVFLRLDALPQATLAAVDGQCLGGGCELAAFCDVVLATARSWFGQPEIDVGCFPPLASVLLPRVIGRRACELILEGAPLSAVEAARIGLVNRVVDDLDSETGAWVERMAGKSAAVLALARKAVRRGTQGSFADALTAVEEIYRRELLATEDAAEGVRAFLEKRKPRWTDR
jgi:cyclohexa-1,5-dienecarbonyl-CoA hydratase